MDRGVCVITGGGRGIGAATARRVARAGWRVCLSWHTDRAAAESVAAEVGGRAVRADVAAEADVVALFAAADEMGRLTAAIANAGIVHRRSRLDGMDAERMGRLLEVNVLGVLLTAREAVRRMSPRHGGGGGAIVTVSSAASRLGSAGEYVDYAASKGASTASPSAWPARSPPRGSGSTPSVPAWWTPRSTRAAASRTAWRGSHPRSRCSAWVAPRRWPPPSSGCSATSPPTPRAPSSTSAAGAEPGRRGQRQTAAALPPTISARSASPIPAASRARR